MNLNDAKVLDIVNSYIASGRLNKIQILQLVELASISNDINDLKDNMNWENL